MRNMDRSARQQALAQYEQLLNAWNVQDADAFGAAFTDDGSSVGFDGSMMNGRQDIVGTLRGIFTHHRTGTYVARIREVRELGSEVVLVRAVVGMVPPGADALNPAVNSIQSLVMTRHGDEMRVALLHNTPAAFHGRPELVEQLTRELTDALRTGRVVTGG